MSANQQIIAAIRGAIPKQVVFITPGTYSWTVPDEVTSICVVCVGGGGGSPLAGSVGQIKSGAGGGLAYKNNITVTPGNTVTVIVGEGGDPDGGDSKVTYATTTVTATGAKGMTPGSFEGTGVLGGTGGGCVSAYSSDGVNLFAAPSGGGAGGYSGSGGSGGLYNVNAGEYNTVPEGGTGGGGAGGASPVGANGVSGGGGGGVGLLGTGSSGGSFSLGGSG